MYALTATVCVLCVPRDDVLWVYDVFALIYFIITVVFMLLYSVKLGREQKIQVCLYVCVCACVCVCTRACVHTCDSLQSPLKKQQLVIYAECLFATTLQMPRA